MRAPASSTTAAVPCGTCPSCGGQKYLDLVHLCQTAVPIHVDLPVPPLTFDANVALPFPPPVVNGTTITVDFGSRMSGR